MGNTATRKQGDRGQSPAAGRAAKSRPPAAKGGRPQPVSRRVAGNGYFYPWWSRLGIVAGGLILAYGLLSLAFDTGRWLYYFATLATLILIFKLVTKKA